MNPRVLKIKLENNFIANCAVISILVFIKEVQTLLAVSGILGFLCLGCVQPHFLQDYSLFSGISLPFLPVNSTSLCFEGLFRFIWGLEGDLTGGGPASSSLPPQFLLSLSLWGLVAGGVASQSSDSRRCHCQRFFSFSPSIHTH